MESNVDLVVGRMDSRLEDVREDAEVMLVGLADPFIAPGMDGLDGRELIGRADGGPIDGRAARRPGPVDFWTFDEVIL